ncbi:hypothetical protein N9W17_06405 [Jannaschia sp.]|nr:hypothetical protein [Jannaschia sp.]
MAGITFENSDPKRFLYTLPDPDFDDPTTVTVIRASPSGNFRHGLHIVVENLSGPPLEIHLNILPMCSVRDLNYLETTVRSGNGDRKEVRFWHEAGMLQQALQRTHNRYNYQGQPNNPIQIAHWHQVLEEHLLEGTPVRAHTFHLDTNIRYYPHLSPSKTCSEVQWERIRANDVPGILRIRFEPDGDVTIKALDSNENIRSASLVEPDYQSFMRSMSALIETLPSRFVDNAPPRP